VAAGRRRAGSEAGDPVRPLELDAARVGRRDRPHHAVVDIGSNSVRLVVYDELSRAPFPRFNEKSLCRLGEGLEETGRLGEESFARTVEACRRFRAISDAMAVARTDVLATEAVRKASNGEALIAAIAEAAGFEGRVLSGAEEARFAGLGVISGFYRPTGLVGDMGGGSLEVVEVLDDRVGERHVSLPLGALPVQAMLASAGRGARRRLDALLTERLPPAVIAEPVFYAVGGGFRAIAKAHMAATGAAVRVVHGYALGARAARDFAKRLWNLSPEQLAGQPGVPQRRLATLPAAALVLDRLLKRLEPDRVVFSALGLREGWLYAQLSEAERYLDPLVEGAQIVGMAGARVPAFGAALAEWTDGLFPGETPADRRLRIAACALTDIAWRSHVDVQAEESFHRLLQFPLIGLDHLERVYLAAVIHARYGGGAGDPATAAALALLSPALRRRARILGRALRLGHRLSGCVGAILEATALHVEAGLVRLEVRSAAGIPDSDTLKSRLQDLAKALRVPKAEIAEIRRAGRT
jgi:exopolyphosphatase/guanosine-5'-triphosphate,3'-diphosphate pyrophosphatase